jgi:Protein of unknown function (DUF2637)
VDSKTKETWTAWPAVSQGRVFAVIGYGTLALVEACVASMSWAGLSGWAHASLHLTGIPALMVPISLDGAAAASAFLALRAVIRGDSAAGARMMVVAFTAASAYLNWHHADTHYADSAAALFFAGMSIAVLALFELALRELRRTSLRAIGAVERPIAKFRALRWLRFPRETFAAWSLAIRHGYATPTEALARVWDTHDARVDLSKVDGLQSLDGLTKAELARAALTATSGKVPAALEWLKERGASVDRSYVYEIARQKKDPRELTAA